MSARVHLHDERAEPSMRMLVGGLLARATHADLAITHVRLLALDLAAGELARLERCRLLIGRLDAAAYHDVRAGADIGARLARLRALVTSGTAQVRASGVCAWTPDFSIFSGMPRTPPFDDGVAGLVGAHYFMRPMPVPGAAFTCMLTGRAIVERLAARFEESWHDAHDVREAVVHTLDTLGALGALGGDAGK